MNVDVSFGFFGFRSKLRTLMCVIASWQSTEANHFGLTSVGYISRLIKELPMNKMLFGRGKAPNVDISLTNHSR